MIQVKTYQYKLNPTSEQEQALRQWVGACRYVYNLILEYKKTLWDHYKISLGEGEAKRELAVLAKEYTWIGVVNSQTRQAVVERVFNAYERFFTQGNGFPQFAKIHRYKSIAFKQNVKVTCDYVQLPGIGKVKYFDSKPCIGNVKRTVVCRFADGWYVNVLIEADVQPLRINSNIIGIDLGVKSLLVTSNGEITENPRHYYKAERKLKRLHRSVARKQKGGQNRKKAAKRLAQQHQKVANTRKDFHHKVTTKLIRENQSIIVEDLKVNNLLANHNLTKSIQDAGWGQLRRMLEYKAKWYGRDFILVNPQYTSQDCSTCGYRNTELTLKVRSWTCPACNSEHDRDINAARNIKKKGAGHTLSAWDTYVPVEVVAQESLLGGECQICGPY